MECREMISGRANVGAKALNSCLRGCRVTIGEVKGETFMEVIETLVLGD